MSISCLAKFQRHVLIIFLEDAEVNNDGGGPGLVVKGGDS